jgi:hypothetical protein
LRNYIIIRINQKKIKKIIKKMAPKRKRSRSKSRSRSRSPQSKKPKSKAKASKTSKEEKKSTEEKTTYGTAKEMSQALRASLGKYTGGPDGHYMDPGVLSIIEKTGNFHQCDGPTEGGKLCYKDPSYFVGKYNLDCSSYCRDPIRSFERLLSMYRSLPQEITVTGNDGLEILADRTDDIAMQLYGPHLDSFQMMYPVPGQAKWKQIYRDGDTKIEKTLDKLSNEEAISLMFDSSSKWREVYGPTSTRIEISCIYKPRSVLVDKGLYDAKLVSPNLDIRYDISRVLIRAGELAGTLNYILTIYVLL